MTAFRRIAVIGSGAIGSYYGARLATTGTDVTLLARSDFQTLAAQGIRIEQDGKTEGPIRVGATDTPEKIGVVDLVVVAIKATANSALLKLVPPLLGPETAILTLENGLGSDEFLATHFGADRILGGLCFIAANRTAPGRVWCLHPGSIAFGEYGRPAGDRLRALVNLFERGGVKTSYSDDLSELRWRKLVWNIPFNGLAITAGGVTTDKILGELGLLEHVRALMEEVVAAAAKFGHRIPAAFVEKQIEVTYPMGPYKPSSLIDYLEGREVEVEAIWGEPLRRAQAAGAHVPRLEALYADLVRLTSTRSAS